MSTDELLTKTARLASGALHLRLQQQSGQLEQPSRLRLLRRDVARIETVLSKRAKRSQRRNKLSYGRATTNTTVIVRNRRRCQRR